MFDVRHQVRRAFNPCYNYTIVTTMYGMVGSASAGSHMRSLMRAAADRPVWSWLAIPLLVLAACVAAFNPQAPLPLWILAAPVWARAVAARAEPGPLPEHGALRREACIGPAPAHVRCRIGGAPGGSGVCRGVSLSGARAAPPARDDLPLLAGAHVWCTGINVREHRMLGA